MHGCAPALALLADPDVTEGDDGAQRMLESAPVPVVGHSAGFPVRDAARCQKETN